MIEGSKIIELIDASPKKEQYDKYIAEVAERCLKLIKGGEKQRALNEFNFMVENLKKEFNL